MLIQMSYCCSFKNLKYEHEIFRITLHFLIGIMHKTPHILSLDAKVDRNLLANHQRPSIVQSRWLNTKRTIVSPKISPHQPEPPRNRLGGHVSLCRPHRSVTPVVVPLLRGRGARISSSTTSRRRNTNRTP